jgi:hypothetical protein
MQSAGKITIFSVVLTSLFFLILSSANYFVSAQEEGGGQGQGNPPVITPDTGDGSGHVMIGGNLNLVITKMISLDNQTFVPAPSQSDPVFIPENKSTRVYLKTTVLNRGPVTAVDIHLGHVFLTGLSDMEAQPLHLLTKNVNYNATEDEFIIDRLPVGSAVTFKYSYLIEEKGHNDQPGVDQLILSDYDSALPVVNDGFAGTNVGSFYSNYLLAGTAAAFSPGGVPTFETPPIISTLTPNRLPYTGFRFSFILLAFSMVASWLIGHFFRQMN